MVSIQNLSLSTTKPKPGQAVKATLAVFTDSPDQLEVILHVFGLGSVPITATTGPGQVTVSPESNGNSAAWAVTTSTSGALTFTATFTASEEPYLWQGAAVAEVTGGTSQASQAVGFQAGRVVTLANGQPAAQMPTTPAPLFDSSGSIWLTQLNAPITADVGADITAVGGPAVLVWGPGGGFPFDLLAFGTGGPVLTFVTTTGQVGTLNAEVIGTGEIQTTVTAGSTGIVGVNTYIQQAATDITFPALGVQIGVGVYPPTTSLGSPTTSGGGPGLGAGVSSLLESDWPLLAQLGMVTAADVTDQLLSKKHPRKTPVAMAYRRR